MSFEVSAPVSSYPLVLPERCVVSGYELTDERVSSQWLSNRSASWFRLLRSVLAPNFSLDRFLYSDLWVMHQDHVSRLSAWVSPVVRPYLLSYGFLLPFG